MLMFLLLNIRGSNKVLKIIDPYNKKYECQKCAYKGMEYLEIRYNERHSKYCIQCYDTWVSKNIPNIKELKQVKDDS